MKMLRSLSNEPHWVHKLCNLSMHEKLTIFYLKILIEIHKERILLFFYHHLWHKYRQIKYNIHSHWKIFFGLTHYDSDFLFVHRFDRLRGPLWWTMIPKVVENTLVQINWLKIMNFDNFSLIELRLKAAFEDPKKIAWKSRQNCSDSWPTLKRILLFLTRVHVFLLYTLVVIAG